MTDGEAHKSADELDIEARAQIVPESYFNFIASAGDKKKIEPALIFTRSDLVEIKKYIHTVHALPTEAGSLVDKDGYLELGLDPADILHFYQNLRGHALTWEVLEDATKDLGAQIELFSDDFTVTGNKLVSTLESTEGYRNLKLDSPELADLTIPQTSLNAEDRRVIEVDVRAYLEELKCEISSTSERVTYVKSAADHFAKQIGISLSPSADQLIRRVRSTNLLERLNSLRSDSARLDEEISEKDREYSTFVGYSFTGLVFGPLGVLVTGGIYGAKAEVVRKQRKQLSSARAGINRKIELISPLMGDLEHKSTTLRDLKFRLNNVEVAAKNLEDVWRTLDVYIDRSEKSLETLRTDIDVAKFIWDFHKVLRPWQKIGSISRELSKIFNESVNYDEDVFNG